ncbi:unnamed protein product, partial [Thlaspi arvense]
IVKVVEENLANSIANLRQAVDHRSRLESSDQIVKVVEENLANSIANLRQTADHRPRLENFISSDQIVKVVEENLANSIANLRHAADHRSCLERWELAFMDLILSKFHQLRSVLKIKIFLQTSKFLKTEIIFQIAIKLAWVSQIVKMVEENLANSITNLRQATHHRSRLERWKQTFMNLILSKFHQLRSDRESGRREFSKFNRQFETGGLTINLAWKEKAQKILIVRCQSHVDFKSINPEEPKMRDGLRYANNKEQKTKMVQIKQKSRRCICFKGEDCSQKLRHFVIPQERCAFVEKAQKILIVRCQSHVDFKSINPEEPKMRD